jgi:Uma2 family endonuclease
VTAAVSEHSRYISEGGFTAAYLHSLPEDGLRRELIDGSVVVSPSATWSHNIIARWIANVLEEANPGTDYVVSIDQSATVDDNNEPRPDIVVGRPEDLDQTPVPIDTLLLAGEVVSPGSVLRDTETKRALYARAQVPAYWIVVPDRAAGTIALAELVLDGESQAYRYSTHYTTGVFRTERPWPVEVDLPALAARLARYRK